MLAWWLHGPCQGTYRPPLVVGNPRQGTGVAISVGPPFPPAPPTAAAACRSAKVLRAAGCSPEVVEVAGKGHAMVDSPRETRELMRFWSGVLASQLGGEFKDFVEIKPCQGGQATTNKGGAAGRAARPAT